MSTTSSTPFDLGLKLFGDNRFVEAGEQFTLALRDDPNHVEALRKRSDAFYYQAKFDKAAADIEAALKIAPGNAELYLDRATFQSFLDEMAETLPDLEKVQSINPDSVELYVQLAVYWLARCNLEKLKASADKILALDPESPDGFYFLNVFYAWNADYDHARFYFDQALHSIHHELRPSQTKYSRLMLHAGLLLEKDCESATVLIEQGLKAYPKLPFFYLLHAQLQSKRENRKAVDADLDQAEQICRQHDIWQSDVFLQRSLYFKQVGESEKTLEQLDLILKRKPNDPWALSEQIGLLCVKISTVGEDDDIARASESCNRLIGLASEYYYPYLVRFWLREKKGEIQAAKADFRRAMLLLPRDTDARAVAAWFLIEGGESGSALKLLDDVIKTKPKDGYAYALRGMAWYHTGAYELGVEDLSIALKIDGPDAQLLKYRGLCQLELGGYVAFLTLYHYRRAIGDFERALNLVSDDAECWRHLGVAWFRMFTKAWFGRKKYLRQSIVNYSKAIELNPKNADIFQFRALSYWYSMNYDAVVDDCDQALDINPNHFDALELRCKAYRKLNRFAEADADRRRLDKMDDARTEA